MPLVHSGATGLSGVGRYVDGRDAGRTKPIGNDPASDRKTAQGFQRLWRWSWRVLLLVTLVIAGLWAWQVYREQANAPAPLELARLQQVRDLESAVAQQTAELKRLRERLAEQEQVQDRLQRGQATQALELANAQRRMSGGDLLPVLEAEALLRLAAQHLWVSRSVNQALPLLVRADGLLAQCDDPALAAARAALIADITALKLVAMPDVEGVYLRLDALQDVMGTLRLVPQPASEPEAVPTTAVVEGGFWVRLRDNAVAALRRFSAEHLRVRTLDQAPAGLLSTAAEARLRQYLRLLLSQAQLALLERQSGIYETALTKTATLLEAHFGTDPRVAATVAELQELRDLDIAPALPDLATAREQLRSYVTRQTDPAVAVPTP